MGVVARADSLTNPQNFLMLVYVTPNNQVTLFKCVNGVLTMVQQAAHTYADGGLIELRLNGTGYEAWYRNALKHSGTVDEATINNNTIHGLISPNGVNNADSFFLLNPT
jgi:hypothetical protein